MRFMHRIVIIIGVLMVTVSSCKVFKDHKEAREIGQEQRRIRKAEYAAQLEAEERQKAAAEAAPSKIQQLVADSLLLQFERRPCFGRCPIYKIKVYQSGYTTYDGVNFVDNMGYYKTRLPQTDIAKIYTMIAESRFFQLEDEYDNENITDLPSMIFRANAMGRDKRIIARYNIPEELNNLSKQIDELFRDADWQAVE